MKILSSVLVLMLLVGCTDAWERRQKPCGFEDGQWVWHKRLQEIVIIDRMMGEPNMFETSSGKRFPLRCEDVVAAR